MHYHAERGNERKSYKNQFWELDKGDNLAAKASVSLATPLVNPQVNEQVARLLKVMLLENEQYKTDKFKRETLQRLLGLNDQKPFTQRYIKPALKDGMIEMTQISPPADCNNIN